MHDTQIEMTILPDRIRYFACKTNGQISHENSNNKIGRTNVNKTHYWRARMPQSNCLWLFSDQTQKKNQSLTESPVELKVESTPSNRECGTNNNKLVARWMCCENINRAHIKIAVKWITNNESMEEDRSEHFVASLCTVDQLSTDSSRCRRRRAVRIFWIWLRFHTAVSTNNIAERKSEASCARTISLPKSGLRAK